jgi:hypothetical protein
VQTIVLAMAAWMFGPANAMSQAQPDAQPAAPPDVMEVVTLENISPTTAQQMLHALIGRSSSFRSVSDGGQNLIVMGKPDDIEQVKHALVRLDRPSDARIKVFSLQSNAAADVVEALKAIAPETSLAVDVRTNSVIASGPPQQLSIVEALLQRLDEASAPANQKGKSYKIELYWLMEATADIPADTSRPEPDQRIKDVIAELAKQGYVDVQQVSRASVAVRPGGRFHVHSVGSLGQLSVQGKLAPAENGRLDLSLDVRVAKGDKELVSLSTEIATEIDHDVVLGSAGELLEPRQRRSAFVVRIRE